MDEWVNRVEQVMNSLFMMKVSKGAGWKKLK